MIASAPARSRPSRGNPCPTVHVFSPIVVLPLTVAPLIDLPLVVALPGRTRSTFLYPGGLA